MEDAQGKDEILALVHQRIKEGWDAAEILGRGTMVVPPENDRKRYWCAAWKSVVDVDGTTYIYPHWIGEE